MGVPNLPKVDYMICARSLTATDVSCENCIIEFHGDGVGGHLFIFPNNSRTQKREVTSGSEGERINVFIKALLIITEQLII